MREYMTESCEQNTFYLIELPPGAAERRLHAFNSADEAAKAYSTMSRINPQFANQCAVWFCGHGPTTDADTAAYNHGITLPTSASPIAPIDASRCSTSAK